MTDERNEKLDLGFRDWLSKQRWFGGKARTIREVRTLDTLLIHSTLDRGALCIAVLRVEYEEGPEETYFAPVGIAVGPLGEHLAQKSPELLIARTDKLGRYLSSASETAKHHAFVVYDAFGETAFYSELLDLISAGGKRTEGFGQLSAWSMPELWVLLAAESVPLVPKPIQADQSNSCVVYGEKLILKLFRRAEPGINPELEIGKFLTETAGFPHVPAVLGAVEYQCFEASVQFYEGLGDIGKSMLESLERLHAGSEPRTVAVVQTFVPGAISAWEFTLDGLADYFNRIREQLNAGQPTVDLPPAMSLWNLAELESPAMFNELAGGYVESAGLLGRRTGELHLALASDRMQPAFIPEPFTEAYQESLHASMRRQVTQTLDLLRKRLDQLPHRLRPQADDLLRNEERIYASFDQLIARPIHAERIRCHGDYHLGQVLFADGDFTIIDFEGEPARSLEERRSKRSPLVDVAGMVRSFHYAASQALFRVTADAPTDSSRQSQLGAAADAWYRWTSAAFLRAYRATAGEASFLPRLSAKCDLLLQAFLMDKAVYELAYELNNRPDWVQVPLAGLADLIRTVP